MSLINSIMLIDDENLFHLVFEDACSLLDITLNLSGISSSDEAVELFRGWMNDATNKPECVFVDLNIVGSTFNGIELVEKINNEFGNGVVIGIISSSSDEAEINKAIDAGAQFWIVKTDDIEPRLEKFKSDYEDYMSRTKEFTVYS